ncbi:hypothetical protein E0M71_22090 [Escherichia coli]|nr:hypothetical protein [Escherichia coli]EIW8492173.1 hypothetical protein [Klebsiella pneumoniae]EEW7524162.1 hypothetical protein [Escherichia coli]EFA4560546.1 hypothetical protein [Escherichia coli]EFC1967298.1 hypothetical protein [Escherichia coli]
MTKCTRPLKSVLFNQFLLVVILVVLTGRVFRFSLLISQLLAKAIPVREPDKKLFIVSFQL